MRRPQIHWQWIPLVLAIIWTAGLVALTIAKETPVAGLSGKIIAADTGRPIANATVYLNASGPVELNGDDTYTEETDENGRFGFANLPVGDYIIKASGKVHRIRGVSVSLKEGQVENLNLELSPDRPYLNLYISQQMFTTKEKPEVTLDGFTESDQVAITLNRVNIDKLFAGEAGSVRDILSQGRATTGKLLENNSALGPGETTQVEITKRDSEGVYQQRVNLAPRKPGIYIVTVSADGLTQTGWISVSDISLITKDSGTDLLAYAVRPDTGAPVGGVEIKVFAEKKTLASGVADANGLWIAKLPSAPKDSSREMLIIGKLGESAAFLTAYSYQSDTGSVSIYTYTDRPVYRPGQTVYFKGIVRKFANDAYHAPQSGQATVEVRDKRNTLVFSGILPLNRFGSFHGSFKLSQYAPTGGYDVTYSFGGRREAAYFVVAEYRKPEFTVSVDTLKKRYVRGDTVKAKIKANYYFGAPVAGAKVSYSIFNSNYFFSPFEDEYDGYEYDDYGGYGEVVREGTVRTGPDGTAEIEFPAYWKQDKNDYDPWDRQFTISASVTDPSRREAAGEGSVIVTHGEFDLNVQPVEYVAQIGKSARFNLIAVDYDRKPMSGVEIDVTASKATWKRNRENYHAAASARTRTDKTGRAFFAFKPKSEGSYVIHASCRDDKGNLIKTSTWIWVPGRGEITGYKYPELQVILDKKIYNQGDTAKVLINSSEKGATALVTIEGRRLFEHRLVKLNSKSTVIEIPVKPEYRPNFYVSVCYVKNKDFVSRDAMARVSLKEKSLRLTVTPNKKRYEPGEEAIYRIKTTDGNGRPVIAEVSLGVVDEAIYAIREDDTTPILDFFYHRVENSVNTRFSFPMVYLSSDKSGYTGKVRKEFKDTAYWRADVVTGPDGKAQASFKLPDNLTTWRATARACTLDTAVGQTISKITVTKNLLVRLEMPRFLVQKDETVISAIVHNYLPRAQKVDVRLSAHGLRILDDLSRTINIESQGIERIDWRVRALRPGKVTVTAYAVAPAASDAMQLVLPIRPHGQRLVEARALSVSGGVITDRILARDDSISGASEIRLRLSPSLASTMLGSLDYLAQYPYGCTEQTMSAFLPDVVIWQTLKSLGIDKPDLKRQLPDMIGKGLNRLYDFQNSNGGWGWTAYGQGDLWMSSYVVFGLLTAKSAGFAVNQDVLDQGLSSIEQMVKTSSDQQAQLYAIYVLSLAGRTKNVEQSVGQALRQNYSSPDNVALAAMILANTGRGEEAKRQLSRLWHLAAVSRGYIHWERGYDRHSYFPTETTAYALMAIVKITPDDPRIPQVVRWLLEQRKLDHWYSTRDTALILYALSDYLAHTKELQPEFTATMSFNGRKLGVFKFDKNSLFQPEREIIVKSNQIHKGSNFLHIVMNGRGRLYYNAEFVQYIGR
ncbi:MAG: alpha-2-macroglobulin family protein, partial [Armatimonadota bacterium]|nr:alpha-2-macroglobulin family protein [Armatimonadota bacterium]